MKDAHTKIVVIQEKKLPFPFAHLPLAMTIMLPNGQFVSIITTVQTLRHTRKTKISHGTQMICTIEH